MAFEGPELRRDSLFRGASFTKPIVAAAAMILVDELRLSMDSPVADLLPELAHPVVLRQPDGSLDDTVPVAGPITLRDLLTFGLGLGESAGAADSAGARRVDAAAGDATAAVPAG